MAARVPSPAALASHSHPAKDTAAAAPAVTPVDPSKFGRVDEQGTVFVTTTDGEREVGSWQAGTPAEALEHFGRRYDDLATEAALLKHRLNTTPAEARSIRTAAQTLLDGVPEAKAVGDLIALARSLDETVTRSHEVEKQAQQDKADAKAAAIAAKEKIAAEAHTIGESSTQWKAAGDRLRELLDEWKAIKGVDRKTDDELWARFSAGREAFNKRRGSHFAELDRTRSISKVAKEELIAKAEALSSSTEWGETAAQYRELMDQWKAAGRAPREIDDKLWARFRAAQDVFFEARKTAAAEQESEFEANGKLKEELLAQARSIDTSDVEKSKTELRKIQDKWEEIGKVPRARINELEGGLRAIERTINDAEQAEWRRTDPAAKARAQQFWDKVDAFEASAAKAQAAGKTKDADAATAQAAQWREWALAAESAVDER